MSNNTTSPTELSPLKRALLAIENLQAKLDAAEQQRHEPLAIIGLGCRIPGGAGNAEQYRDLLRQGRFGVREIACKDHGAVAAGHTAHTGARVGRHWWGPCLKAMHAPGDGVAVRPLAG